ncbi:MAG: hypothetical protein ACYDBB_21675 [Armatimonadota bacterium]
MQTIHHLRFSLLLLTVLMLFGTAFCAQPSGGKGPLTFTIKEAYGVSHPMQIIDFDLQQKINPRNTYLVGPDGAEVPYQLLEGGKKLAVQTDLPANGTKTWTVMTGKAPMAMKGGVQILTTYAYYEITNGLTGVHISVPSEAGMPAPIRGIRLRDGQWTATGFTQFSKAAKTMSVRLLEEGPLKTVAQVSYSFEMAKERGKPQTTYYTSTITLEAGQPSILIEEESDTKISYSLDVYPGLQPTQAMYRGHHASSVEGGRGADGSRFVGFGQPHEVGYVDMKYATPRSFPRIAVWNPWVVDSGWLWQMYNADGAANSNLLGIYAGRTSRAFGARYSGMNVATAPGEGKPACTINMTLDPGTGERAFPRARFQWGIFVGTKGDDLKGPTEIQPINQQMNIHAGINLNKIYRMQLEFPDPKQGYGALYMDGKTVKKMIDTLRKDKEGPYGRGLYGYLFNAETSSRELVSMWADPTGEKLKSAVKSMGSLAKTMLDDYVNRDGIYNFHYHYWMGGLNMMRAGVWADSVLADELATPEDKAKVKAIATLYGTILWDDDFVPMQKDSGIHLGTENMPVQEQGYRTYFALLLAGNPAMRGRVKQVQEDTLAEVRKIINEYGAEMGCVHYIGASFEPTLNALLQIKQLGETDPFKTEPRLAKFAEFYMNLQTPPEIRFGTFRKNISTGDGPTESSEMFGQLATGFRDSNPELSARTMWAWNHGGKPHSGFFGTTLLMIDESAPEKDPQLGNANFPGYYSVLRHGWGTPNETALWFINGDFYRDHRHNDRGEVIMYALGVPLALDWGSQYAPHIPGGFMHSGVLPEANTGHPWDGDSPPLNVGRAWANSTLDAFASFQTGAFAKAHFATGDGKLTWTRTAYSIHPNEQYPVIVLRDTFAGENAAAAKIFTQNLIAEGDVDTPAGKMTPPVRNYGDGYNDKIKHDLASAGQVFTLQPGLNRLGFTGVQFGTKEKPVIGIDFDVYTLSDEAQQAHIGNWADNWVGGAYGAFQEVNGRPYAESQHILRMKGTGAFTTFILPHRKGEPRKDLKVIRDGNMVRLEAASEITLVGDGFYAFESPNRKIVASFSGQPAQYRDISIEGGPAEVIQGQKVTLTIHGDKGVRTFTLPGEWKPADPKAPIALKDGKWVLTYAGDVPLTVVLEKK